MKYLNRLFYGLAATLILCLAPFSAPCAEREFNRFALTLPEGWDGEEQTGFVTDNPDEYQLTLGKKEENENKFAARISVFMLPNASGTNAEDAAEKLTEAQGDPTAPIRENGLWTFEGEPRSHALKGRAKTWVNTNPRFMLIIIAQDPSGLGAEEIVKSMRGLTPEAKELLGR